MKMLDNNSQFLLFGCDLRNYFLASKNDLDTQILVGQRGNLQISQPEIGPNANTSRIAKKINDESVAKIDSTNDNTNRYHPPKTLRNRLTQQNGSKFNYLPDEIMNFNFNGSKPVDLFSAIDLFI